MPEQSPPSTRLADNPLIAPGLSVDQLPATIDAKEKPKRERFGIGAWLATLWLAGITLAAILAPVLPIEDPNTSNADIVRVGPLTNGALLGGDGLGRDVFSRCIWGARTSLLIGFGAIVLGLLIGGALGLIAGYYRGKLDSGLSASFNILLAFPQLVLALTLVAVLAPSTPENPASASERLRVLIITLGIVSIPVLARITRANTLAWAQREFVLAGRAQGAKNGRIILREVLPNVMPAMFSIALLGVAVVIVIEGGLSILGLSVPPPTASRGNIIAEAQGDLRDTPHSIFAPSAFIFLTVLSLNYLGDVVRARFDVREAAI
jgi:peptide/nickel transport system permease protein